MPGPAMRVGLPRPDNWVSASERGGHAGVHDSEWQRDIRRRSASGDQQHEPDTTASKQKSKGDGKS